MKYLYYFTPRDLQVARVDRQCIVRFCEAFAKHFDKLYLVSAKVILAKEEPQKSDLYKLYGVDKTFEFIQLKTSILQKKAGKLAGFKVLTAYTIFAFKELRKKNDKIYIYLKNYFYAVSFLVLKILNKNIKIIFEVHYPPTKKLKIFLLKKFDKIIANSFVLADELMKEYPDLKEKILGTHQGINLEYVNSIRISKEKARKKLNLPIDKKIVIYTGKVSHENREIDYYIEAAKLLSEDFLLVIIGGRSDNIQRLIEASSNIPTLKFISFVPPSEIYYYHFAADALLIYYPSGIEINKYRSPGKLFDYMASGNPIIAADYDVLKEVIKPEKDAFFVQKDNPQKLREAIIELINNDALAKMLANNAMLKIKDFTWTKRAENIWNFIKE
jgi:glycosyltransferase involved in cell wall biosynthesis